MRKEQTSCIEQKVSSKTSTTSPTKSQERTSALRTSHLPKLTSAERIAALQQQLPESYKLYADKYFLRSRQILAQERMNPFVRAQVFIRKGPGEVRGLEEAIAIITKYSDLLQNGGKIYALSDGDQYQPNETLLVLEGRIQDLVELETQYLGVISEKTSLANGLSNPDLKSVRNQMARVVGTAQYRPVIYMGARHWSYRIDDMIASAAFAGGATATSTDIGAATASQMGVGTIPHALENIMAARYSRDRAVVEATRAFDRVIAPEVPRIALIDYNNREIHDALTTAIEMGERLFGVRVDTCGENVAEGAIPSYQLYQIIRTSLLQNRVINKQALLDEAATELSPELRTDLGLADIWIDTVRQLEYSGTSIKPENSRFWFGRGVTISGVLALRRTLQQEGFDNLKIVLSSGFANVEKVAAFVAAENRLGIQLFDTLGVGQLFESNTATMDIVAVADSLDELDNYPCSKQGRSYRPNPRLRLMIEELP